MKRILALCLAAAGIFCMTACGGNTVEEVQVSEKPATDPSQTTTVDTPAQSAADAGGADGGILIAYFTYGENADLPAGVDANSSASIQYQNDTVTGNTGLIAYMIAEATGGELFSIRTTDPYPETYDATIELAQEENTEAARPTLATHIENLDAYDTIFLGFPNWWYDMPMALYSFLEEYDFSGKTIVPFVTSGGSGFSGALDTIAELQPDAAVLDGLSISGSSAADAQAEVTSWLADLGFTE